MAKIIIACDSGLDGAICVLKNGEIKEIHQMPTFETKTSKKSKTTKKPIMKRNVDGAGLVRIIAAYPDAEVFIENVHSLHKVSAASNFSMGQGFGILCGIVRGLGLDYYLVRPKMWQEAVWIESDKVYEENELRMKVNTKKTSLNAAIRHVNKGVFIPKGCRVPKDGMFDSFLIAKYGEIYLESLND